ncbi:ABC transporter substrate-binding protein [Ensifer adhaerens]|uniref:ABC transporter substrate-binding protein n=1 Tax=Ensifer adhaerens TaxID=106592 RepID=UPI003D031ACA
MVRKWRRRDLLIAGSAAVSLPGLGLIGQASESSAKQMGEAVVSEIRFKDLAGNEVTLAAPARRIVDLWTTGAAFAIAAHGSPSRLVGINNLAHSIFKRGIIGRLYPEVLQIPADVMVGNTAPNIERLVNLDPDIVVDMRDDPRDVGAGMKAAGLTVARYGKVPGGIQGTIEALLMMFGRMIGDTSRAERIIGEMTTATKRLAQVEVVPRSERSTVLLLMPSAGRFYVSGGGVGGLYSDFIYAAGGVNAAAALPGFAEATVEQIATWDPDVLLIFQSEEADPALIYNHPILGAGKAAARRKVYVVPIGANNWGSLGPDEYLFPIWLAELLYPDRMERLLRRDMRIAYTALFDRHFSREELDVVLRLDVNESAADYTRFVEDP